MFSFQLNNTLFSADSAIDSQCGDITRKQVVFDVGTTNLIDDSVNSKEPEKCSVQAADSVEPVK